MKRRGKRILFCLFLFPLFLGGCSPLSYKGTYRGENILGADEFVMDSYAIKEGGAESSSSSVIVKGEVKREGEISLPSGFLPLREALSIAGGILYTGDKRHIQVIRGDCATHPKIYILNWKHVVRLPASSLLLIPGDIVHVAAMPMMSWIRLIQMRKYGAPEVSL